MVVAISLAQLLYYEQLPAQLDIVVVVAGLPARAGLSGELTAERRADPIQGTGPGLRPTSMNSALRHTTLAAGSALLTFGLSVVGLSLPRDAVANDGPAAAPAPSDPAPPPAEPVLPDPPGPAVPGPTVPGPAIQDPLIPCPATPDPGTDVVPGAGPGYGTGDEGAAVLLLETRLQELRYDPGTGRRFDETTTCALYAFQKVNGLTVDGLAGPGVFAALVSPRAPAVLVPGGHPSRVEVDLGTQLLTVYRDGVLALVTHISSGNNERFCDGGRCRRAVTPPGAFLVLRRLDGWRTAELGRIYNPVYFTRDGVAVHGSHSVPLLPASHGCVRVPLHTAESSPGSWTTAPRSTWWPHDGDELVRSPLTRGPGVRPRGSTVPRPSRGRPPPRRP
ncbi:MAG: peptidoglycan-binding protein [Actinomycetota bacterium]